MLIMDDATRRRTIRAAFDMNAALFFGVGGLMAAALAAWIPTSPKSFAAPMPPLQKVPGRRREAPGQTAEVISLESRRAR